MADFPETEPACHPLTAGPTGHAGSSLPWCAGEVTVTDGTKMTSSIPPAQPVVGGSLRPGHRVFKYEIRELLEAGPRGSVYLGFDTFLLRPVRIVLLPNLGRRGSLERDAMQRSLRELSQLRDPRLTPVLDAGQYGERYVSVVLAEQADEVLTARVGRHGPLERESSLKVVSELALVLDVVHRAGLAHGGLAPRHVSISADGAVVLDGLGVASWGENPTVEDDLRGLGELLSWLLAGRKLLESDAVLIQRLLEPLPRHRFATMREVLVALDQCQNQVPSSQVLTEVDLPTELDLDLPAFVESPERRATQLGLGPETKGIEGLPTRTSDVELPPVPQPRPSVRSVAPPPIGSVQRASAPSDSGRESRRGLIWLVAGAICLGAAVGVAIATHRQGGVDQPERSVWSQATSAPTLLSSRGGTSTESPPPAPSLPLVAPVEVTQATGTPSAVPSESRGTAPRRPRIAVGSGRATARPNVFLTELPTPWADSTPEKRK